MKNYLPLFHLNFIDKIIEKVTTGVLKQHLKENKISVFQLSVYQHGHIATESAR